MNLIKPKMSSTFKLILFLAIAMVVGGLFLLKNATHTLINNLFNTSQPQLVLILVQEGLETELKEELNIYNQDLSRELNFTTKIKSVKPSEDINALKAYVKDVYKQNKLNGILLIGDIPTGEFHTPENSDQVFDSQGLILWDIIYQDIWDNCAYSPQTKTFSYADLKCQQLSQNPPFWVGRLTPNSSVKDSITLLKDYFKRNHDFRTGLFTYKNKALTYSPILLDYKDEQRQNEESEIQAALKFLNTYPDKYYFTDIDDINSDKLYLTELQKPHEYEILFYNGHGLPTFHQKDFNSSDIVNASFFYAEFRSCSVGRFITKDYIAGQYLFSDGLVVTAASTPIFGFNTPSKELNAALVSGVPFYEAVKITGVGAANILGDPTLKMRYQKNTLNNQNNPSLEVISPANVPVSSLKKFEVKVKNTGNEIVNFMISARYYSHQDGIYHRYGSNFITVDNVYEPGEGGSFALRPGQTGSVFLETDESLGPHKGEITGEILLFSTDPKKLYQKIPFTVND